MNVIVIVLDTLRADHLSCYGYEKPTTPAIDKFIAEKGVLFEQMIAPNIPTHPSFTTMFTGVEAITHDIVCVGGKVELSGDIKQIQEILKENGYTTAAVDNLGRWFKRGFDIYETFSFDRKVKSAWRKAEIVNEKALPLLHKLAEKQPFYLFLHYWDPHTPYLPPPPYDRMFYDGGNERDPKKCTMAPVLSFTPFKGIFDWWTKGITDADYIIAQYDGEIAYLDNQLERVFRLMEHLGLWENTLVIITSDHGEILMDHWGYFDHHGLYEGNVHIPFIMRHIKNLPQGKRVPAMVSNLSMTPTILDLLGIQGPPMEGRSLMPLIDDEEVEPCQEIVLCESTWQVKRGIRTKDWKFIKALEQDFHFGPMKELYQITADPNEQLNLIDDMPEVAKELEERLDNWVQKKLAEIGKNKDPLEVQRTSLGRRWVEQIGIVRPA